MTGSVVREAGLLERYYITRHALGMYCCVAISAKYIGPDGVLLSKSTLFPALQKVVQRHAALAMRLSKSKDSVNTPVYVRLEQVDLSQVVDFSDEDVQLQEALEAQILRRFDTDAVAPLWRLQVLKDGSAIFAWHHGIGDGQSGLAFHRALLSALNEVDQPTVSDPPVVSIPQDYTLVRPIEELADLSVSLLTLGRTIIHQLTPVSWTSLYSAWTGNPVPTTDTLSAPVRILQYTPDEASRILKLCRSHRTTLTPVLHTLSVLIISELLAEAPYREDAVHHLSTSIPVSLRPLTGTPATAFCNEVSAYSSHPDLMELPRGNKSWLDGLPWHVVVDLTSVLKGQKKYATEHTGTLKYLFGNYEGYFKSLLGRKRNYTLQLSNLGQFPPPAGGVESPADSDRKVPRWKIGDVCFTQSLPASGAAIAVNVTGTPSGGIGISVSWGKASVDDSLGEAFCRGLKEALDEMGLGEATDPTEL